MNVSDALSFLYEWNKMLGLKTPKHHEQIIKFLVDVFNNEPHRGLLNAFRHSGKSTVVGVFAACVLYYKPQTRILILSAETSLASRMVSHIKNVLEKIRREIVKVLKNGINDRIFESFDYEFDENITRDDVYQRFERIQEDLVQDYQWLDEDDLEEIQSEIDAGYLVDQINAQVCEDRWASERDDYEDEVIRPIVSDADKIDRMFSDLIHE